MTDSQYNLISQYWSDDRFRTAEVLVESRGFYVVLKMDGLVVEIRDVFDYSLGYAEDLAENFVMKWGEWSESKTDKL